MSIIKNYRLRLDAGNITPLIIHVNQYDKNEIWNFTLIDYQGNQYITTEAAIVGKKPDGCLIVNNCTVSEGIVSVEVTEQMTAAAGKAVFELLVDGQLHGTANFIVMIERSPQDGAIESESDLSLFQQAIDATSTPAIIAGVQAWMDENLTPTTPVVDSSLSISGAAADAKKTGDEISELKSDLVSKDGENQITPQNIEGMQFTKTATGGEIEGENIFDASMLFEEGYYVSINSSGKITHAQSASYNSYCVPVNSNSKYTFTQSRFVALAIGNTLGSEAIGSLQSNLTEIETGEATYLFLSISSSTATSSIEVHEITSTEGYVYSDFILPDWLKGDTTEIQNRLEVVESGKVDINGTGQITPQNIQGVTVSGGNILDDAERLYSTQVNPPTTDGYVSVTGGTAYIQSTANYCSFLVSLKPNTRYTANNPIRFVQLLKNLSTSGTAPVQYSTIVGSALSNVTTFETGEADHAIVSWLYTSYPINDFIISEGDTASAEQIITLPDWLKDDSGDDEPVIVEKPNYAVITGNIASGGNLQLTSVRNNLRKGERVVFEGNITSFESLRIGLSYSTEVGTDSNQINTFRIDTANISYYARSTSTPVTVAHGLTIANNIQIIWEMTETASVKLTLVSNGNLFTHEFAFTRQAIGNPFVLSSGTVLSDCKLTWTCVDLAKKIWMFGDSYFGYNIDRWSYYLHQYGYDKNCLLDGYPGESGTNGRVSFNNLLQYGTPKYAVWCLGMNDSTDSSSAPSSNWVNARDYFLTYCMQNNVTPIFATIPTVPSINHDQKNAWIKSSGYRYIDFAKAVGADSSGTWYGDMLSNDGVHPTETGAKALFAQVLIDLPEIMLSDFGY